jgi:hypothetical protein
MLRKQHKQHPCNLRVRSQHRNSMMPASCGPMMVQWQGQSLHVMSGSGSRGVTGYRSPLISLTGQQSL